MAAMVAVSDAGRGRRREWNTLERLRGARVLLVAMDALLAGLLLAGVAVERGGLRTVGRDAAPSIVAAQGARAAVAAMDAETGHQLLSSAEGGGASLANYDAERVKAAAAVLTAAENITYGEAERGPIRTLENGLAVYEDLAQRARDLHEEGGAAAAAGLEEAAREARTMVDRSLLPASEDLDRANMTEMEARYGRESAESVAVRVFAVLVGLATVGCYGMVQMFLTRRTRRTLNVPLLAATLLGVGMTVAAVSYLSDAQLELRMAKVDAFGGIHALWRARAVGFAASSEESRWLLAGGSSAGAAFAGDAAEVTAQLRFAGDGAAAAAAGEDWERYVAVDAAVRRLEAGGRHGEAVALATQTTDGSGAWALGRFDRAVGAALAGDQRAFDGAIERGDAAVRWLGLKVAVGAGLMAVLSLWGLGARIREYV